MTHLLPTDPGALLFGRIFRPDVGGPSLVAVRGGRLVDISRTFPTARDLCEQADPATSLRDAAGEDIGDLAAIHANSDPATRDISKPWLLSPIDLQAVKAAGVTFATSLLERVIEEKARGDAGAAASIRVQVENLVGNDLRALRPGSPQAMELKQALIKAGAWSQYLEVGIGPDAEIFTKGQPLSTVGTGVEIGVHPASTWNNPEPELVLVIASSGRIIGATLGNDVNLRDVEGRSALLLGKAKDNNAAAAVGPFVRLFDGGYGLEDVRRAEITLRVEGADGYVLDGRSSLSQISRDPTDLAAQAINDHHAYPDGLVLYLGTLFAPIQDRDEVGRGFTHKPGDVVRIACPELGTLSNRVVPTDKVEKWTMGTGALMRNLAARGLLRP
ncbi:fumarylacetoacetate hydrolase family protein [Niveispirillum irakense]|uniref:fumarylacetoacetate hydrolase family protein n=1 Tax=Niveispirillum irakense TaxID=34011 RepID=UPI00041ECF10|nr:fumarylacetoacetate hydrolase family protein [Niveispirillum irakense]